MTERALHDEAFMSKLVTQVMSNLVAFSVKSFVLSRNAENLAANEGWYVRWQVCK